MSISQKPKSFRVGPYGFSKVIFQAGLFGAERNQFSSMWFCFYLDSTWNAFEYICGF